MDTALVIKLVAYMTALGERALTTPLAAMMDEADAALEGELAQLGLPPDEAAICLFNVRLALAPRTMSRAHTDRLREAGLSEVEIHDVVNVVCCFSYMNRLADGLGVEVEPHKAAWALQLMGEAAVARHAAWAA